MSLRQQIQRLLANGDGADATDRAAMRSALIAALERLVIEATAAGKQAA